MFASLDSIALLPSAGQGVIPLPLLAQQPFDEVSDDSLSAAARRHVIDALEHFRASIRGGRRHSDPVQQGHIEPIISYRAHLGQLNLQSAADLRQNRNFVRYTLPHDLDG
jgi:hypothetical protein